jgi:metal-responsive CopG/Arc/MetJ family transcriptional regulator
MTRITVTIPDELGKEIEDMAAKDNRKIASMAAILLARQVKEANRKKKLNGSSTATDER